MVGNSIFNQILITYTFEGDDFEGVGGSVNDAEKEFPEVYDMLENLEALDLIRSEIIDTFESTDFFMASTGLSGEIKFSFAIKRPLKSGGQITHALKNTLVITVSLADEPSFNLSFTGVK